MGNCSGVESCFRSERVADLENNEGVYCGGKWWIISSRIDTYGVRNTSEGLWRENKSIGKKKWGRFSQLWQRINRIKFWDRILWRFLWVFGKYAENFEERWFQLPEEIRNSFEKTILRYQATLWNIQFFTRVSE